MTGLRLLCALVLIPLCGACIPIPTVEHDSREFHTRGSIDAETIGFIANGTTTKEDVLHRLGEPELVWNREMRFLYHWKVVRGYVIWGVASSGGGSGAAGGSFTVGKDYLLLLKFDEHARVTAFEIRDASFSDDVLNW